MVYNIFISHSWAYSDAYDKLVNFFDEYPRFSYKNHSIPKDDPIHTNGTDKELYNAIYRKLYSCNAILIMGSVYSSYSKWIKKEIIIAQKEFNVPKPIIAVKPWAQQNLSTIVQQSADVIVGWNSKSIIDAIRTYSR